MTDTLSLNNQNDPDVRSAAVIPNSLDNAKSHTIPEPGKDAGTPKKKDEFFDTQISLTEWLGNMSHQDSAIHRHEDNEKRERLAVLHEIIGIPFDRPVQFSLSDVIHRSDNFNTYLHAHGDHKCALRLIPLHAELPKLRMRGKTVREVTEGWLQEQDIDPTQYRADFVPHAEVTTWSTIFIVNDTGIRGEIIADTHEKLTQGYYGEHKPIHFEYDFNNWKLMPPNPTAQNHLETVIKYLYVASDTQTEIVRKLNGTFSHNYLNGYFETVDTDQGLWFIDYNRLIRQALPDLPEPNPISVLSGRCASKGRYTGTVSIVNSPLDANFNDGDILVCDMTSPNYLPLMIRAGAVITNRGGVTCHAAIVARELGIPCIVGTEIATTALKNGQMVTVDANNGVVLAVNQ